jgi:hypothetical protein
VYLGLNGFQNDAGRSGARRVFCEPASRKHAEGACYFFFELVKYSCTSSTREAPVDFRAFLSRRAELFRALPEWELRLLVPEHLRESTNVFEAAAR